MTIEVTARFSHNALKSTTELRRLQILHRSQLRSSGERKSAQNNEALVILNHCVWFLVFLN
jgi:hypothetical protein